MAESLINTIRFVADALKDHRKIALCLLTSTRGSTPAQPGAMIAIDEHGHMSGTIGGGCVEAEVRRRVLALLTEMKTATLRYTLDHDYGWDDGLICGGEIEVAIKVHHDETELRTVADFIEKRMRTQLIFDVRPHESECDADVINRYVLDIPPHPRLFIAGAGHIGQVVARLAIDLDFDVTVFDDRDDLLYKVRKSIHGDQSAIHTTTGPIHECMLDANIDDSTYIVIVTRGHRHDEEVLAAVLDDDSIQTAYIGMIGSKRKVKLTFEDLQDRGITQAALEQVHAPIGLPIHAVTVHEIALSIMAEIVSFRRRSYTPAVSGPTEIA